MSKQLLHVKQQRQEHNKEVHSREVSRCKHQYLHLHGGDDNMVFDDKNGYTWSFQGHMSISFIQLVDFDIPVPPDKSSRLFVRVPNVGCVQASDGKDHDLCYMISLYKNSIGRIQGRATFEHPGLEIPVVIMGNTFTVKVTDQDGNIVRLMDHLTGKDDFDFIFKINH